MDRSDIQLDKPCYSTQPGNLRGEASASSVRDSLPSASGVASNHIRVGIFTGDSHDHAWFVGQLPTPWTLLRPIFLEIETDEDGTYIVSDRSLGVFGTGESKQDATDDYYASLVEYCELILADRQQPSVNPLLKRLSAFVSHPQF
jgi:hypothetical protein